MFNFHLFLQLQFLLNQSWLMHHSFDVVLVFLISKYLCLFYYLQLARIWVYLLTTCEHLLPFSLLFSHLLLLKRLVDSLKLPFSCWNKLVDSWPSQVFLVLLCYLFNCFWFVQSIQVTFLVRHIFRQFRKQSFLNEFVIAWMNLVIIQLFLQLWQWKSSFFIYTFHLPLSVSSMMFMLVLNWVMLTQVWRGTF